jgi:arylsulfatase A-like enzyme
MSGRHRQSSHAFAALLRRGVGILILLAALLAAIRIVFPRQDEDRGHLNRKREYLARIADIANRSPQKPNIVLILFDDLGYGDLESYGGQAIHTPHLDRLAANGIRFTHAYSASPYCSASRAGLLTGRYALRSGLDHVLQAPWSFNDLLLRIGGRNRRLPSDEIALSELLSAAGYATGMFGKWHLGDESPSLPNDWGFDHFFGLLHSNDQGQPVLWENRKVLETHPIDQSTLTGRYTARAIEFVENNRNHPLFLYLPHTFPHIPLHAPAERLGRSSAGLYGDVVEELDASVGQIIETLRRLKLENDTLLIASSDNGPWFQGSPGGTRGRKMGIFEGGVRVPLIASWPGRIPTEQVREEPVMGIDLFPTILEILGLPLPEDRLIDGRSLVPLLEDRDWEPREALHFYQLGALRALRSDRFKYHDRHRVPFGNPMNWAWGPMRLRGPWLFDLARDPDESYDVSSRHPEVARRLRRLMDEAKHELQRNRRGWLPQP